AVGGLSPAGRLPRGGDGDAGVRAHHGALRPRPDAAEPGCAASGHAEPGRAVVPVAGDDRRDRAGPGRARTGPAPRDRLDGSGAARDRRAVLRRRHRPAVVGARLTSCRTARRPRGPGAGGMVAPYAYPFTGSAASLRWPVGTGRPWRPIRPGPAPCLPPRAGRPATR